MKCDRVEVSFLAGPQRVRQIRRITAAHLRRWHVVEPAEVDAVLLVVSEIVTNAVVHGGGGTVRFALLHDGERCVRVEVDDGSAAGRPQVRLPGADEENGRGLLLVTALAEAWGRDGTCVWCTVAARRFAP